MARSASWMLDSHRTAGAQANAKIKAEGARDGVESHPDAGESIALKTAGRRAAREPVAASRARSPGWGQPLPRAHLLAILALQTRGGGLRRRGGGWQWQNTKDLPHTPSRPSAQAVRPYAKGAVTLVGVGGEALAVEISAPGPLPTS